MKRPIPIEKPKIICYCGSLRFIETFRQVEYISVLDGEIALLPCCMFADIERTHGKSSDYKQKADELHKRKIDICDEVFVLNVGGYIGDSTQSEIEYALKIGKTVKYLEPRLQRRNQLILNPPNIPSIAAILYMTFITILFVLAMLY